MHTSEKPHVYLIRIGKDNPGINDGKPRKYVGKHTAGNILYVGSGSAFPDYNIPTECSPEKLKEIDVTRRVIGVFDTAEEAGKKETELLRLVKNDKRKLDRYINKAFFENGHLSSLPGKTGTHGERAGANRNDPVARRKYNKKRYLINKQQKQEYKMNKDYLYEGLKLSAEKKDVRGIDLFGSCLFGSEDTPTKSGKEEWFDVKKMNVTNVDVNKVLLCSSIIKNLNFPPSAKTPSGFLKSQKANMFFDASVTPIKVKEGRASLSSVGFLKKDLLSTDKITSDVKEKLGLINK